jgi:peptidoglycan/xylan/chitin deacetylase (PgdA/CDA1 family)
MTDVYLCLHGLGPPPPRVCASERPYWLSAPRFVELVELARRHTGAGRRVHLTFDDGNKSDMTVALPILREHGCRAAFFVSSDVIGAEDYLDAGDIARLHAAGMTIGSHGAAHVRWTQLSTAELTAQLERSITVLSNIVGAPVSAAAPPFGGYNRRVLRVLRGLRLGEVHTTDDGETAPGAWLKRRFTVRGDTPLEAVEARLAGRLGRIARLRSSARHYARQLA